MRSIEESAARFSYLLGYECVSCGRRSEPGPIATTCPDCGPIRGTLDAVYDLDALRPIFHTSLLDRRDEPTLWRYHELLPVRNEGAPVFLPAGMTPLIPLRAALDGSAGRALWVKDDTRFPSGSAKDRASAVAVAHAREAGARAVAAASTGNAAASLAAFAAAARLPCVIFVPSTAPPAKLVQIRAHGARLFAVRGTYDEAYDLCRLVCERTGLYNRNTASNPVLGEGKKTASLEIWEQLGYRAPDVVIVPVGDGCILGGVYKGFLDLRDLGLIPRLPRLIGVQAEGSSALATAWRNGVEACVPAVAATVADSLAVSIPRDQVKALRAVRASGGGFVTVSDEEILRALGLLATRAGLFVEPAAAAPLAGLEEARRAGMLGTEEEVVLLHTGHGLKDIAAAGRAAAENPLTEVGTDSRAVESILGILGKEIG